MSTRHFRTSTILLTTGLALVLTIVLSAIGATVMLDLWIVRGGGSVNTMAPGFTYAAATVMKVGLLETVILLLGGIVARFRYRTGKSPVPIFGVLSVLIQPLGIFVGAALVLGFQRQFVDAIDILATSSAASRVGVIGMMCLVGIGVVVGAFSLIRRENPKLLPVIAIVSNLALLVLFRYFEFYKLGFDQDRWAE